MYIIKEGITQYSFYKQKLEFIRNKVHHGSFQQSHGFAASALIGLVANMLVV